MSDASLGNKKLSVCQIIPSLPLHGAQNLLLKICQNLNPEKINTSILLLSGEGPLIDDFKKIGIPVTLIRKNWRYDISIIWRVRKYLRSGRFDIVHTHLFTADFWGRLAALNTGISIVSTAHNGIPENITNLIRLENFFNRILARFSEKIICVTNQVRNSLLNDVKIPIDKLMVIDNGIEILKIEDIPPKEKARKLLDIEVEVPVIGVVGRFSKEKNHPMFIKSLVPIIAHFPKLVVLLVGEGGELERETKSLVTQLNIERNVRFLGLRRDISIVLRALDSLVIPSISEGLPMVLIEAMTLGTPVIATRVGGIPDAITEGNNGLLAELNQTNLTEKILWALENPSEMEKMAEQGFGDSRQRFDIYETSRRYFDLYKSLQEKNHF